MTRIIMIIKLNDKYRLTSEPMNIVLERKTIAKTGKNAGQEYWIVEGYYPNLKSALDGLFRKHIETTKAEGIQNIINAIETFTQDIKEQIEILQSEGTAK
jgi:hypothetical protein